MRMLALSACAFCAIAAALHLASIAAVVMRMRRSEADEAEEETLAGVSIVRPVCGLENFTEETLLSGFLLEYPDYEILFCVAQQSDPIIPLIRRLIELHPHVRPRLPEHRLGARGSVPARGASLPEPLRGQPRRHGTIARPPRHPARRRLGQVPTGPIERGTEGRLEPRQLAFQLLEHQKRRPATR